MTKDEYVKQNTISNALDYLQEWSSPMYECPECKEGNMRKNLTKVLCSLPPKYEYKCDKCGHVDYLEF